MKKRLRLKDLIKEEVIAYRNPNKLGEEFYNIDNKIYKINHFSGGTAIRIINKLPSFAERIRGNINKKFIKQIIKSIKNKKNNMGSWYNLDYNE